MKKFWKATALLSLMMILFAFSAMARPPKRADPNGYFTRH